MMITSDKFKTSIDSFRSRLISPVFSNMNRNDEKNLCLSFVYNIYSEFNDGFNLYLENYLNSNEIQLLLNKTGPLPIDKWYYEKIEINNLNYSQYRVFFFFISIIIIFNFIY